ncbi:MAG: hypothetical protein ACK4UJ_12655 [Leptonema sp. (in: bacteria)]
MLKTIKQKLVNFIKLFYVSHKQKINETKNILEKKPEEKVYKKIAEELIKNNLKKNKYVSKKSKQKKQKIKINKKK